MTSSAGVEAYSHWAPGREFSFAKQPAGAKREMHLVFEGDFGALEPLAFYSDLKAHRA